MKTIHAVYEDGVFKPVEPVSFPEHSRVRVELDQQSSDESPRDKTQAEIYEILGERYDSGDPFGAERHNNHQP